MTGFIKLTIFLGLLMVCVFAVMKYITLDFINQISVYLIFCLCAMLSIIFTILLVNKELKTVEESKLIKENFNIK